MNLQDSVTQYNGSSVDLPDFHKQKLDDVVNANGTCEDTVDLNLFIHYSLIPSVVFILVLSFFERRNRWTKIDGKIKYLNGRFGFVVPLDLIGAFSDRWTYGFAFGAIANTFVLMQQEKMLPSNIPPWSKGLFIFLGALEVGLSYFPIFACLNTHHKIIGPVIGFFYTLLWLSVTLTNIILCPHETEYKQYEKIISNWPSMLCLLFLLCRFVHKLISRNRMKAVGSEDDYQLLSIYQACHVKRLLKKPVAKNKSWIERKIYTWDPCFKYPNRLIGTTVLSLICLYIFITSEYNLFKNFLHVVKDFNISNSEMQNDFICIIQGVWIFTTILSSLTTVTYVFHILACYRKQLKYLWAGNKWFLPIKYHKTKPSIDIIAIARYSSCQVVYIISGYLMMHILQLCIGTSVVSAVHFTLKNGTFLKQLEHLVSFTIIPVGTAYLLLFLQTMVATKFFLQGKLLPSDKDKPLALDNRKAFENFNYFFFFNNVIVGVGSCLS